MNNNAISYPESARNELFAIEDDSFWFLHRNGVICEMMQSLRPIGEIVDIGGGNGFVAAGIEQAGFSVTMLEPGRQGCLNARKRGVTATEGTLRDIETVPNAGLFDVLEHIEDDRGFLVELREKLQGRLFLTVPACPLLWSQEDEDAGHFRRYTKRSLKRSLEDAGFSVERMFYFFGPLVLPVFLARTIPFRLGRRRNLNEDLSGKGPGVQFIESRLRAERRAISHGGSPMIGSSLAAIASVSRRP